MQKHEGQLATECSRTPEERLLEHATFVLEDEQRAVRWIHQPHTALGGRTPLEMATSGNWEESEEVRHLLNRVEYGVYS